MGRDGEYCAALNQDFQGVSGMISIEDLKRFDVWAVERGYSDPSRYMAACEAFEAQQVIIDELKANAFSQPMLVTLDELNAATPDIRFVIREQKETAEIVRPINKKGKRPPGDYHKKRGANGRFA